MSSKHTRGKWRIRWDPRSGSAEIETVAQEMSKYRHLTNNLPMAACADDEVEMVTDRDGRKVRYSAEACANARVMSAGSELYDLAEALSEENISGVSTRLVNLIRQAAILVSTLDYPQPVVLKEE